MGPVCAKDRHVTILTFPVKPIEISRIPELLHSTSYRQEFYCPRRILLNRTRVIDHIGGHVPDESAPSNPYTEANRPALEIFKYIHETNRNILHTRRMKSISRATPRSKLQTLELIRN
ncbi:hypothetical protein CBL_11940 [Carabus blaptoides fortunei]